MNVNNLACDQEEYLIIVAVVGGIIAVVIVIVIVMALVKYFTNKDSDKYKQCDYLQYNYDTHQKVVNTYIQRSPSKPYYAESDQVSSHDTYSNDSSKVNPYLRSPKLRGKG